jgi:hypothetical protein
MGAIRYIDSDGFDNKWCSFEGELTKEQRDLIEAVVAGAKVIPFDTIPRKWAVIAYEGIPDTQPSIHPNKCNQGESTPHIDDKCGECPAFPGNGNLCWVHGGFVGPVQADKPACLGSGEVE